jgi:hypothetical protein
VNDPQTARAGLSRAASCGSDWDDAGLLGLLLARDAELASVLLASRYGELLCDARRAVGELA